MPTDDKIKVVLIRKEGGDEKAVSRLSKTLSAFAALSEITIPSWEALAEHNAPIADSRAAFLDLSLLPPNAAENTFASLPKNVTLFQANFPTDKELSESPALKNLLAIRNSLFLDQLSTPDLLRVMHLYLLPKRQGGIITLMEKGAVILGEKVQTLEHLGEILDRLVQFFHEQLPSLSNRFHDLRQLTTALFHEAFQRAKEAGQAYPTVDFQVSGSRDKIVFFLRFPLGNLDPITITEKTISAELLPWHLAWKSSDYFLITEHKDLKELEVTSILQATTEYQPHRVPSLLFTTKEHGSRAENLLSVPKNYRFSLVSELAYRRLDANKYTVTSSIKDVESELDAEQQPEKLKFRIQQMEQERSHLHELIQNREGAFRDIQIRLNKANMEVIQKRNEMLRILKEAETSVHQYKLKMAELEKRAAFASESLAAAQSKAKEKDNSDVAIRRLEGTIKTLEREKIELQEKLVQEQKRYHLIEQKFSGLHKDLSDKDKHIADLKSSLHKSEQSQSVGAHKPETKTAPASSGVAAAIAANNHPSPDKEMATKLKDTEAREAVLKQEIKKLTFKIEQSEKNVKVIQAEHQEKAKLLERKLEGAKTKEIELLKKIDELTALLKKATKVA